MGSVSGIQEKNLAAFTKRKCFWNSGKELTVLLQTLLTTGGSAEMTAVALTSSY
jgi:hypothetical protein